MKTPSNSNNTRLFPWGICGTRDELEEVVSQESHITQISSLDESLKQVQSSLKSLLDGNMIK